MALETASGTRSQRPLNAPFWKGTGIEGTSSDGEKVERTVHQVGIENVSNSVMRGNMYWAVCPQLDHQKTAKGRIAKKVVSC